MATKDDIAALREQMDLRFARVDEKIDRSLAMMTSKIEDSISRVTADLLGRQLRFVFAMLTFLAAAATIVTGVVVAL